MRTVPLLGLLLAALSLASASDLPVTCNVQDRPMKTGTPAGTHAPGTRPHSPSPFPASVLLT